MSASSINIAAPVVPGVTSVGGGVAADGALGGFDALMSAFFASTDAALQIAGQAQQPAAVAAPEGGLPIQSPVLNWEQMELTEGQVVAAPAAASGPELNLLQPGGSPPAAPIVEPKIQVAAAATEVPAPVLVSAEVAAVALSPTDPAAVGETEVEGGERATDEPASAQDPSMVMALLAPLTAPPAAVVETAPAAAEPAAGAASTQPVQVEAAEVRLFSADQPAAPLDSQLPEEPKLEAFAEKVSAEAKPTAEAPTSKSAHPSAIPAVPAAKAEPAPVPAPVAASVETAVLEAEAVDAAPAPAAKPEKPSKAARSERGQPRTEDAAAAGATRNPQAATPAVSAAAQADLDKGRGPAQPGLDEIKTAEPAAHQAEAPLTAETAHAPAASPSAAGPQSAAAVRGSPETVANLAAQIVKKLGARTTNFDVQLDPLGLGRVNVRVEINADGRVSAAMQCDNPQAAAELKSRANELHRALAQSGFDLTGGLTFDVAQDRGSFAGQQQAFQGDDNPGHSFRGRAFAAALETAGDAAQAALSYQRNSPSGVDVRI